MARLNGEIQVVEARSIQAEDAQKQMKLEKERVKARLSQEWAHSTSQGKEISSLRAELTSTRAAMQDMRDLLQNTLDDKIKMHSYRFRWTWRQMQNSLDDEFKVH